MAAAAGIGKWGFTENSIMLKQLRTDVATKFSGKWLSMLYLDVLV